MRKIAVAAGKGGVGKSTLTVLVASALKRLGDRVGILDADLYGPSIGQMLPEGERPMQRGEKWIPAHTSGVQFFSQAFFAHEGAMRAPIANQILKIFFQHVEWDAIDWLLVDFPPGTGDIPLSATQLCPLDGALIVSTPQKIALLDVKKTINMFRRVGVPLIGFVENMSYYQEEGCSPFGRGRGRLFAEEEGIPFLGSIPLDPTISLSADEGRLLDVELDCMPSIAQEIKRATEITNKELVQEIVLENPHQLKIIWENETVSCINAQEIQKKCPCARCSFNKVVSDDVFIKGFEKIGRYGLSFHFSSGCSAGIYPFSFLQKVTHVKD